jgi:hypothetical protein
MKNRLFALVIPALLLTGCATTDHLQVSTAPIKRVALKLPPQKPLDLGGVHFKVVIDPTTKQPQYVLDGQDFDNLANNMEKIQNRLELDEKTIKAQKNYYK